MQMLKATMIVATVASQQQRLASVRLNLQQLGPLGLETFMEAW